MFENPGKSWTVKAHRGTHTVKVKRKPWFGIAEIQVNGKLAGMFAAKILAMSLSGPKEHPFEVDGVPCVLRVQPGMLTYAYELYADGKLVEPDVAL